MENIDQRLTGLIRMIVGLLVSGDYCAIEIRSRGIRLNAEQMKEAVQTYGRTLQSLPETSYAELDVIRVSHATSPTWSITVPLWTVEEGRSDLTLECTVIDKGLPELDIEIDNLHVL
jgi:hypothetical protein